jgi:hypothetical protein
MDIFSMLVQAISEADRISKSASASAPDRATAAQLRDTLSSMKGGAFRLRGYLPPSTPTPVDVT